MAQVYRCFQRSGLAGTVPVLRPCPGVPAGLSNCPGFLYRIEDQLINGKETWAAWVETFFFLDHLKLSAITVGR